jgi:hypothetical protein
MLISDAKLNPRDAQKISGDRCDAASEDRKAEPESSVFQQRAFTGVFGRSSGVSNVSRSAVDMSELAHPVYAPGGSVLRSEDHEVVDSLPPQTLKPPRTSPFGKS